MVFQELIIGILAEAEAIGTHFGLSSEPQSALTILNLMFCIESVLVGWLFTKAFSASRFYEEESANEKFLTNHAAVGAVAEEHGHHFAMAHVLPKLGRRSSVKHDAGRVEFTDSSAMKELAGRSRRESAAADHSRFSVRAHEQKPSPV